ncbi:hypothetical protein NIZ91_12540 [Bacillus sp. 1780r2a1]|uniref:hypothetical protein n=1 Tax=Priestia TaxID=2800373 RepID=UPI00220C844B|nr:hypothetical protein [Priestia flexa]MDT2046398.1 hypothetical protein [Priestia flexa]USY53585.1 hypothetical protein NIZ91_12540 [Bacillus sp. 1780r2a1]
MNELMAWSEQLQAEATSLLEEYQLLHLCKQYGNPLIAGSFDLNVMVFRHLDVYIGSDKVIEDLFFALGKDLAIRMNPVKMVFVGNKDEEEGMTWSIYANVEGHEWKININVVAEAVIQQMLQKQQKLKAKMTEKKREHILFFKQQSGYNRYYKSAHVYEAVLVEDVQDDMTFFKWLQHKKRAQ